jgi:DnaJ-class molecular chaperone
MATVRTHYDNLKVSRDAPPEVIRAAHKALSLLHHPDRNSENPRATQIMQTINASYEILSDPAKRQEHDQWIVEQEGAKSGAAAQKTTKRGLAFAAGRAVGHMRRHWVWYLIAWAIIHTAISDRMPLGK